MKSSKEYLNIKGALKALVVCILLLGPSLIGAPQARAEGPADFLDSPLKVVSTGGAFFDNYRVARYLELILGCIQKEESGDEIENVIVGELSAPDAKNFKIFRDQDNPSDDYPVGHELDSNANMSCKEIQDAGGARIGKLFGNDIMNFVNLFYTYRDGKYHLENATAVATKLLAKAYFEPLHEGDVRKARLAVAFSHCFEEAPKGVTKENADFERNGKIYIYRKDINGLSEIGIGQGVFDNTDRGKFTCADIVSAAILNEIPQFMKDNDVTTGTLRNSPQEVFNSLGTEGKKTYNKRGAIAAISTEFGDAANQLLLYKCISDSAASGHVFGSKGDKPPSPNSEGTYTKESLKKFGSDELTKALTDGTLNQGAVIASIADWLVLGNNSQARALTGWLVLPGNADDGSESVLIEATGLDELEACIVDNMAGVKKVLEDLGVDLAAITEQGKRDKDKGTGGGSTGETDPCLSKGDNFVSWIACPLINLIDDFLDTIRNTFDILLQFSIEDSGSGTASNLGELKSAWNVFRGIASILIIIFFLTALLVKSIKGE